MDITYIPTYTQRQTYRQTTNGQTDLNGTLLKGLHIKREETSDKCKELEDAPLHCEVLVLLKVAQHSLT